MLLEIRQCEVTRDVEPSRARKWALVHEEVVMHCGGGLV